jgi:hypothetical protein
MGSAKSKIRCKVYHSHSSNSCRVRTRDLHHFLPKKLRLQIFILSADGNNGLVTQKDLIPSVEYAGRVLKDRFGVTLIPYSKNWAEMITEKAPNYALNVHCNWCGYKEEYKDAGEYFAKHLAGWNAIPISLSFPITVFIVENIVGKNGCSFGPLTDYVTLDVKGVAETSTMMHEMGHACNLWHCDIKSNLMWPNNDRGDAVKTWQKIWARGSRHITFW